MIYVKKSGCLFAYNDATLSVAHVAYDRIEVCRAPSESGERAPIEDARLVRPGARRLSIGMMVDAANYSVVEPLRDGRRLEIRAFKPSDRADLESAVGRTSTKTMYRRFFTVKRSFSEREREFFLNVDFVDHVALVAWVQEAAQKVIVGGGRYVVVEPGKAEVAFTVVDQYQGQGIGAALMRHLAAIARATGLKELIAEVLSENAPMLKVFEKSGLPMTTTREADVVQVALRLV